MGGQATQLKWVDFKALLAARTLALQWRQVKTVYQLVAFDGAFRTECVIRIEDPANADQTDFETNYKNLPAKPVAPRDPVMGREIVNTSAFAVNIDYEVKATGYAGTAVAGTTTHLDFPIGAEDRYIHGLHLILKNHASADTVGLSFVDKDGVYEGILYPPGTPLPVTLKSFGATWNVDDTVSSQGREGFNYIARVPAGVYMRLSYTSTGGTDVTVKVNAYLHKKVTA